MKKEDLKDLLKCLKDIHPIILSNLGVLLLCLPLIVPIENKNIDNAMFVTAMAMLGYSSVYAIVLGIKKNKQYSRKEIERQVKKEIEQRKKEMYAKRNIKQK